MVLKIGGLINFVGEAGTPLACEIELAKSIAKIEVIVWIFRVTIETMRWEVLYYARYLLHLQIDLKQSFKNNSLFKKNLYT